MNKGIRYPLSGIGLFLWILIVAGCSPAEPPADESSVEQEVPAAQSTESPAATAGLQLQALEWRNVGPFNGGRGTTVVGHPTDKMVFYFGHSSGGLWNHITASIKPYQTIKANLTFDGVSEFAKLIKGKNGHPEKVVFNDPAAVKRIGFKDLPLKKMGLYQDERRASWPVHRSVRPVKLPGLKK